MGSCKIKILSSIKRELPERSHNQIKAQPNFNSVTQYPKSGIRSPTLLRLCTLQPTRIVFYLKLPLLYGYCCSWWSSHGTGISKCWGLLLQLGCTFTHRLSWTLFWTPALPYSTKSLLLSMTPSCLQNQYLYDKRNPFLSSLLLDMVFIMAVESNLIDTK